MSSTVYETIKASHQLPSPTGVALEILQLVRDEGSSLHQIASVVDSDPAISSRLLKLVNAPLAGLPRQIASVHRAVALLGVRTVTGLALGFSLVSNHRQGGCSAFDYELFWSDSLGRAVAARQISGRLGSFAPDEAFTCALLSKIGRLALATAFPEAYAEALEGKGAQDDPVRLAESERTLFQIDHNELTAEMMSDWHMPSIFSEAVRVQDAPDTGDLESGSRTVQFARILHMAGSIARILSRPVKEQEALSGPLVEATCVGITPYVFHELFDSISREWRDAGTILSVKTRQVPPLAEMVAQAQQQGLKIADC